MAAAEDVEDEEEGAYISFISFPGLELALESLDPQGSTGRPELIAVKMTPTETGTRQVATVFVPFGQKKYFVSRLEKYLESANKEKAKHAELIEGIASIRRATIRDLWTDSDSLFPDNDDLAHWWEVWLRQRDGREVDRFKAHVSGAGLKVSRHFLGFGDRTVILVRATVDELAGAFDWLDDIAELRRPHDLASFLPDLTPLEQADWAYELQARVLVASPLAPAVCLLDTGVQANHPLLQDSLSVDDAHVAEISWAKPPVWGHGTEMAGLALYGDLDAAISSTHRVQLRHRLESVKFLPDRGENERDLYGALTARSIDRPEIQAPSRQRVFMLAVTSPRPMDAPVAQTQPGRPTSWSASIDALAFGRSIDDTDPEFTYLDRDEPRTPRLFVVSAGNIRDVDADGDHLARSDLEPVEDPAHAWNAICVGAYTEKDSMEGAAAGFATYSPIASRGELSPTSRTSVLFDQQKWPFKPDVVAEGGNAARSPGGKSVDTPASLALLTTRLQRPGEGLFGTTRDTSAATAQVSELAATIISEYPSLRPETVRALIVHSAEWTPAMLRRFERTNKGERVNLLRRYGMGVPDKARALYSASDALTLIAESEIHPYVREGDRATGKAHEMNVHALPWPIDELEALGDAEVRMRVTLSYFIEPNPSSRGWTGRYVYPSHGLRFATRRPEDSLDGFRKRINTQARLPGEKPVSLDTEEGWWFGSRQQQSSGSLHTDIWEGPAARLANKGAVAVYPVAGWWKTNGKKDQSALGVPYALVVSIESPEIEVDLWTAVANKIEIGLQT
ncbi:S8 family peptidase [Jannaschia sp. R86511]|uniref:S8 family peptidase n=1 Tax=Jannaschia sp. R86511 TaxID=3093853 RepID=UPI0036D23B67